MEVVVHYEHIALLLPSSQPINTCSGKLHASVSMPAHTNFVNAYASVLHASRSGASAFAAAVPGGFLNPFLAACCSVCSICRRNSWLKLCIQERCDSLNYG